MINIQNAAEQEHMIAVLKRWVPIEYHWMLVELTKPPESHAMSASALGRKESCVLQTVFNGMD